MSNRGIYGQAEGNEEGEVIGDLLRAAEIAEGDWVKEQEKLAKRGDMKGMAALRDRMKYEFINGGVKADMAQERADTVLRQALRPGIRACPNQDCSGELICHKDNIEQWEPLLNGMGNAPNTVKVLLAKLDSEGLGWLEPIDLLAFLP